MIPASRLARFVALTFLYLALLMSLALTGAYPPLFRAVANVLFHSMGSHRVARFVPEDRAGTSFDTRMMIGSTTSGAEVYGPNQGMNTVRQGYIPAVVLVAFVLATPLVWPRRLWALGIGLLAVHAFVALRVWVALMRGFSRVGYGKSRLLELSPSRSWMLERADLILAEDLHMTFVVPLLIWAVLVAVFVDFADLGQPPATHHG